MSDVWWGRYAFGEGSVRRWRIGPLQLAVRRTAREWNVAHSWMPDESAGWSESENDEYPEEDWEAVRFVFSATKSELELLPALADRPVITSPRVPLFVSPGEETTLFVGSPLWVQLKAQGQMLRELPIQRPSDTWFGPSTREGELCYAASTSAVLDAGNLPLLARRSITPVMIRNRGETPLQVERLKLPVPLLALFSTTGGRAWTEAVTLDRAESSEMAEVGIRSGPPTQASGASRLAEPREGAESNLAMRVFSTFGSLFAGIGDHDA